VRKKNPGNGGRSSETQTETKYQTSETKSLPHNGADGYENGILWQQGDARAVNFIYLFTHYFIPSAKVGIVRFSSDQLTSLQLSSIYTLYIPLTGENK
jgi:hypothetical protein